MKTADDFGQVKKEDNNLDDFIEEYIYPSFYDGYNKSEIYYNLIEQENFTVKEISDRLKELKFKVSSGNINGDSILIINRK